MGEWLHFINLQYWYCIVYSTFGGHCAYLDELRKTKEELPQGQDFFASIAQSVISAAVVFWNSVSDSALWVWNFYSTLAYAVSGFLTFAIIAAVLGLAFIRMREMATYGTLPPLAKEENPQKGRWQALLEDAMSTDPKRWRSAILEADGMLGELLAKLDYPGLNTAERMRVVSEDAFVTVPVAWEAHRIKNFITSGSSDFVLTQRETYRVMKLYEQVFEEFKFV